MKAVHSGGCGLQISFAGEGKEEERARRQKMTRNPPASPRAQCVVNAITVTSCATGAKSNKQKHVTDCFFGERVDGESANTSQMRSKNAPRTKTPP